MRTFSPSTRGCRAGKTRGLPAASGAGEPALGVGEREGQGHVPKTRKALSCSRCKREASGAGVSRARQRLGPSRPQGGVCRVQGGWAGCWMKIPLGEWRRGRGAQAGGCPGVRGAAAARPGGRGEGRHRCQETGDMCGGARRRLVMERRRAVLALGDRHTGASWVIGRNWEPVASGESFRSRAQCAKWSLKCPWNDHGEAARHRAEVGLGEAGCCLPDSGLRRSRRSASNTRCTRRSPPQALQPPARSQRSGRCPARCSLCRSWRSETGWPPPRSTSSCTCTRASGCPAAPTPTWYRPPPLATLGRAWGFGGPGECRGSGGPSQGCNMCRCSHG